MTDWIRPDEDSVVYVGTRLLVEHPNGSLHEVINTETRRLHEFDAPIYKDASFVLEPHLWLRVENLDADFLDRLPDGTVLDDDVTLWVRFDNRWKPLPRGYHVDSQDLLSDTWRHSRALEIVHLP
jgi:hypothetical protein